MHRFDARTSRTTAIRRGRRRSAAALLVCIFVVMLSSVLVISVVDTETIAMTAIRNANEYERAQYLAGAAVHHALAELQEDPNWRDGIANTTFPPGGGDTYSATVVDGAPGTVIVTGVGTSGQYTRRLQVTVEIET